MFTGQLPSTSTPTLLLAPLSAHEKPSRGPMLLLGDDGCNDAAVCSAVHFYLFYMAGNLCLFYLVVLGPFLDLSWIF